MQMGNCNFEAPVLCQALGELQILQGVSLRQAIGESHLSGSCFVLSCWGITSSSALRCIKLFGNSYFPGPALRQAIEELEFAGSFFAPSYWGIAIPRLLFCVKLLGNSILQGALVEQHGFLMLRTDFV